jgi:hypothetical protein
VEVIGSSETLVTTYRTTWRRHNPEVKMRLHLAIYAGKTGRIIEMIPRKVYETATKMQWNCVQYLQYKTIIGLVTYHYNSTADSNTCGEIHTYIQNHFSVRTSLFVTAVKREIKRGLQVYLRIKSRLRIPTSISVLKLQNTYNSKACNWHSYITRVSHILYKSTG